MKQAYAIGSMLLAFLFTGMSAQAQTAGMDTLLWDDFENDPDSYIFPSAPTGSDAGWVNFDIDGLTDANGRPQEWFWSAGYGEDSANSVYASSSWLQGFLPGNLNMLITPPLEIVDNTAKISWDSYPFQGPRYQDGYSVMVAIGNNVENNFLDTLFRQGQMLDPPAATDQLNAANYTFSTGSVFADGYTDSSLFYLEDPADNSFRCRLDSYEFDLSAYEGETIYVAFLHDSDDDNLIAIDNVLVTGTAPAPPPPPAGIEDLVLNGDITLWPNPAREYVKLRFETVIPTDVSVEIRDLHGRLIRVAVTTETVVGPTAYNLPVEDLTPGAYTAVIRLNGQPMATPFMKQ